MQVMLYSIDVHRVILDNLASVIALSDFIRRLARTRISPMGWDRAWKKGRGRMSPLACWNRAKSPISREFARSLARQSRAKPRGIVALVRCHGRVKISKSTGFARRATGEARRGASSSERASERAPDRQQRGETMTTTITSRVQLYTHAYTLHGRASPRSPFSSLPRARCTLYYSRGAARRRWRAFVTSIREWRSTCASLDRIVITYSPNLSNLYFVFF